MYWLSVWLSYVDLLKRLIPSYFIFGSLLLMTVHMQDHFETFPILNVCSAKWIKPSDVV